MIPLHVSTSLSYCLVRLFGATMFDCHVSDWWPALGSFRAYADDVRTGGKSDGLIVPENPSNKSGFSGLEMGKERGLTKGSPVDRNMHMDIAPIGICHMMLTGNVMVDS